MDVRQLKYFVAVADARNFTRASEVLHIAQPPLSRQIQLLEEELGVQLILRNSRPLRLTEAGRMFYEQALQIINRLDQLKTATRQIGLNQQRTLSIGFVASTLYGGLPMLVRKLRHLHPDVDIQLVELTSQQQFAALKSGRIDVGFGRVRGNDSTVARTILREERLVLALPPDSPLAGDSSRIALSALEGQKLIVYPKEPRPSFADHVLSLLNDHAVRPSEVHEVRESGGPLAGFNVTSWNGLAVPARTPAAVVERLSREVQTALAQPDVKKRLLELNLHAQGSTPAQLGEHLAADVRRWSDVIARARIPRQ